MTSILNQAGMLTIIILTLCSCQISSHSPSDIADLQPRVNPDSPTTAFTNGLWYSPDSDSMFIERDVYSVKGLFTSSEPAVIDTVIDLGESYIIPPFGDAHNHAFADNYSIQFSQELFLDQGVFYAMNLTNPYSGYQSVKDTVSQPQTIDVAYSHGGISANKGSRPHPATVMERSYSYLVGDAPEGTEWPLEGNAYWFMESDSDFEEKWPQLMSQNPDVVKIYIMRYGEDDPELPDCGYGLCPDQLRMIVDSASVAGKRVFAHINTARDFQLALSLKVDGIAHLPLGNDGLTINDARPLTLSDSMIEQAGDMGIILTPTAHLLSQDLESFRQDTLTEIIALQRDQLQKLHAAGVKLALGADGWRDDPLREVMHLHAYDMFSNEELIKMVSVSTPMAIFPNRKFAALLDEYEASFVSLDCNPIEDFSCIRKINFAVKQGINVFTNSE